MNLKQKEDKKNHLFVSVSFEDSSMEPPAPVMVITITRWSDRFLIQYTNKMSVSNFQAKVRLHEWCYGGNINELAHQLNLIGDLFTFNDRRRGRKRSPTRAADIWGRRGRGATGHVSRSEFFFFFFFFFLNNTCSSLIRSSIAGVYRILCVSDSEHASRPLTCQSICRQHCTIYSFLFDLIKEFFCELNRGHIQEIIMRMRCRVK